MKFYKCPICGNIITVIEGNEKLIKCCGRDMEELIPGVIDAATEKHVPVCKIKEGTLKVSVGEVEHPMSEEHYIMFIAQVVGNSVSIVKLSSSDKPEVSFKYIEGSKIYSYCNLHGLWVSEIK